MDTIAARGLDFPYRDAQVLKSINFTVSGGRFAVLLGPNGAGKSTLIKLVSGELPLSGQIGKIELLGQEIWQSRDWQRTSYVSQSDIAPYQNFPASVEKSVQAGLYTQTGKFRFAGKKEREQVRCVLHRVGMEGFAKRLIGRLSGEQQQRALLARALISAPRLLLLGGPTSDVNEDNTTLLYQPLYWIDREQGVAIWIVTHDRKRLMAYADDIWLLENEKMRLVRPGRGEGERGNL